MTCVSWISPCENFPEGAIVSGSTDKQVFVWDPSSATVLFSLSGHEEAITSVTSLPNGDIYSASQDKYVAASFQ